MSRIYVCDRCKSQSSTWDITMVEVPDAHNRNHKELCRECLDALRKLFFRFMEGK